MLITSKQIYPDTSHKQKHISFYAAYICSTFYNNMYREHLKTNENIKHQLCSRLYLFVSVM